MKKIFGKLALASLLSVIPLSTASALTIATDPGNWTGYLTGPGQLIYNFDTLTPTTGIGNALNGNYTIFGTPSGTSQSAPPAGSTPGNRFLSVPNPQSNGSATLDFFQDMNYLGLFWGSVDKYNTIEFFNNNALTGTVTGSMVATPASGNQFVPGQNLYVHISDLVFDSIKFTSTSYAFEVDNIAVAPVPEPTTMLLFGTGLLGLAAVGRRRTANKA